MGIDTSGPLMTADDGLRSLLDAAPDALVVTDDDGRIVGWNRAAEATLGWARPAVVGADLAELLVPEDQRRHYRAVMAGFGEGGAGRLSRGRIEVVLCHRDGRPMPVELVLSLIDDQDRALFVASIQDMSERKAAEAHSRRCQTVISSSGDAIWSGSLDGVIESWNPAAERLYGYSEKEVVGRSAAMLRPPADLEEFTREQWTVGAGDSVLLETLGQPHPPASHPCAGRHGHRSGVSRSRCERAQPPCRAARRGGFSLRRGV